ncbi:MAG: DUF5666 domain-containing protein [Steroidobacteraceae bacterium]
MRSRKSLALAGLIALTLVACGGSKPNTTELSTSGTLPNSVSVSLTGTISAFGSVVMNGVHYDTNGAAITHNGQSVVQSALAVGQVARLNGAVSMSEGRGRADRIDVDDQVVGPVSAVDAAAGTLTVLGQQVTVDSNTSFAQNVTSGDLTGVAVGDVVEVAGLESADGSIRATRIEIESAGETFQIVGTVSALDSATSVFKINDLTVNYASAMVNGFASGAPADGEMVIARGTAFDAATTTLTASSLRPADDSGDGGREGSRAEREGLITRFVSATDFDVGQQAVTTDGTTKFIGGTAADLALNVHVEAEGSLNASGVLVAAKVKIFSAGIAELVGEVTAVDATAGTLTVLDTTVTVTSTTRLEDRSNSRVSQFSLADIAVGDTVEVRGFEDPIGSGAVTATRLERERPRATSKVGGFFSATTPPQFEILGVTVDASAATFYSNASQDSENKDSSRGSTLTADEFFAQAPGRVVFASGTFDGTTLMADKVLLSSREDCEDGDGF